MNPTVYAETPRLILRSLESGDLPRLVELLADYDVARWLIAVPYPYSLRDAEAFYERMTLIAASGAPEFFLLQQKKDNRVIGAIGLHAPRAHISANGEPSDDELSIGYWLGKPYWRQGLISEGMAAVIKHAFDRAVIARLSAATDPGNDSSQNVLRRAGFTYLGNAPRRDTKNEATRWRLTREDYEKAPQTNKKTSS